MIAGRSVATGYSMRAHTITACAESMLVIKALTPQPEAVPEAATLCARF